MEYTQYSDSELLEFHNTKCDFVIRLQDGTFIHTDDEEQVAEYENHPDIDSIFWASDFEAAFEVKDELIRRNILAN